MTTITSGSKILQFLSRALLVLSLVLQGGLQPLAASPASDPSRDDYQSALRLIAKGDREGASLLLSKILQDTPQHAGALLDLAILQCELGNAPVARWLFEQMVERFGPPPELIEMIVTLQAAGCPKPERAGPARRYSLFLARGSDTNVNRGASTRFLVIEGPLGPGISLPIAEAYLPKSDQFMVVAGEFTKQFSPAVLPAFRGFLQFQARRHDRLSAFDTNLFAAGAEFPFRSASWEWRTTGSLSGLTYDGRFFQAQQRLELFAAPLSQPFYRARLGGLAAVSRVAYPSLANFNSLITEAGLQLEASGRGYEIKLNAGAARDDAQSNRPGGDRDGTFFSALAHFSITERVLAELSVFEQRWSGSSHYAPGVIDRIRQQQLRSTAAALMVPIVRNHGLRLEVRHTRNDESIPIFGYNSQQVTLGWRWLMN